MKVGISPFGIWRPGYPESIKGFDSYEKLYGDSRKWLREGWIDYFTPQLYWPIAQTAQSYPVLLGWWLSENVHGRHIWPGHNSSRAAAGAGLWGPDELNAQIRATRASGATGDVHFSMRTLMPSAALRRDSVLVGVATQPPRQSAAEMLTEHLRAELYSSPALIPASSGLSTRLPLRPAATVTTNGAGERVLQIAPAGGNVAWFTVRARNGTGTWRSWIIPSAQQRLMVASEPGALRVVVTAVDRFGTESATRVIDR